MQRLRILTALAAAALLGTACASSAPPASTPAARPASASAARPAASAPATKPAAAPASGEEASGASGPAVPKMKLGEALDSGASLKQVWPAPADVNLSQRNGKPLAIFLWGTGSLMSREDLLSFEQFVKKTQLRQRMDVYAVAGFSTEKGSLADVKDMVHIMGLAEIPVLVDPDYKLGARLGAEMYPDLSIVSSEGVLLAKGLRGIDHANLQVPTGPKGEIKVMSAGELLQAVAAEKTGPKLERIWPFYPSDRLLRRKYPDFELPLFSADGWGKGTRRKLSQVLSGKRPAVLMFFSSTCDHCQVDVPQIVKLLKDNPEAYDVVGVTRIRNANHRRVSDAYFKQQGITFPIFEDAGTVSDLYKVTSTPTDFYLSPGGTIVSTSYYQHPDLAADWLKKHPVLAGTPDAPPPPAPTGWAFPLKLKDESGKVLDLASLQGKPTLLHFWATWCGPCRAELPDLLRRLPALEKAGNVLLVTVETDPALVEKYRKDTGLAIKTYLAPHDGLAKNVDFSRSVPRTYLLDAHGRITTVYAGTYDWKDEDKFGRAVGRMTP